MPLREPVQQSNLRVVLARRPDGVPTEDCFEFQEVAVPEPGEGDVLLQTEYLSLDPYMRGRMSAQASYSEPVALGQTMVGQGVARVVRSRHADFTTGDLVVADTGWQSWSVRSGAELLRVPPDLDNPVLALGALGMPGFTAYIGLLEIGRPRPGETLVVSAATGGVGAVVGQIGKLIGCRVVGVAGGPQKCRHAVDDLSLDACIDHRTADFPTLLRAACPDGVDIYFENVGGKVFEAVLPLLNQGGRVPLCGLIAHYNGGWVAPAPDQTPRVLATLIVRRIRMQGFLIFDHYEAGFEEFGQVMGEWLRMGKVRYRHDIVDGLKSAPRAFIGLFEGCNFGKLIVRVGTG